MKNKYINIFLCLTFLSFLCSCTKDMTIPDDAVRTEWTIHKIAVVAPLSEKDSYRARIERTAEWFTANFHEAQTTCKYGTTLKIEWYDECSANIDSLASALSERTDISAIIGPFYSDNVDVFGNRCRKTNKPVIAPVATSEDVIRKYAVTSTGNVKTPFLWSMTETDISQCEALLTKVSLRGGKKICLLSPDNSYGKTFYEWIPFQSAEMGLTLQENIIYKENNNTDLEESVKKAIASEADYIICVTTHNSEAKQIIQTRNKYGNEAPHLLFSDGAMGTELLELGKTAESTEGVSMYADPTSGFQITYQSLYGEIPTSAECMFYDALLLAGCAAEYCIHNDSTDMNEAISLITSNDDDSDVYTWTIYGMRQYLGNIENGDVSCSLTGATGKIKFDQDAYTTRLSTVYAHWMVYDGKFTVIDYSTTDGSNRTSSIMASWNWQAKNIQEFLNQETYISYCDMKDQWAVLICGSNGWFNYRHQSDVLYVYQMLRKKGYDDDHIILITANDLAYDTHNKYQGEVRNTTDGKNLIDGVSIDYNTDTISARDICNIMLGNEGYHLPTVLKTDSNSNVFIYWSGHGEYNKFLWRSSDEDFTNEMLYRTVSQMSDNKQFRKILFCAETCFSGSMMAELENIPGVLGISAASSTEYSFADIYDNELEVWLSDRFTNNLVNALNENPKMTYRELYLTLVRHTFGSHVQIFNSKNFSNLYTTSPTEFFEYENN